MTAIEVLWWPKVRDEFDTIRAVLTGKSLARLGDGEFPHAFGKAGGRQSYHPDLSVEMNQVLCDPHPDCLVGIPTMDPAGPKYLKADGSGWYRHREHYAQKLSPNVQYWSAFVTRPDSAPWIENREFCELFQQAWAGKRVVVVEKRLGGKIIPAVRLAAREVKHVRCHVDNAYRKIGVLEQKVLAARADLALLSCGPTATVLANRLAAKGVQAIDIGSAGAFLLRHLAPGKV